MMRKPTISFFYLLASLALGGCASTGHNPKDPFEPFNRTVFKFNNTLDTAVVKPVAKGYKTVMPEAGKMMVSNFFSNLNDVTVAINDLLQFKVVQAVSDTGRIVINTTIGFLGLVDIASATGFKKHNEDFGQTLGRWGISSGPYLVLPLLGPSSVRDSLGDYADSRAGMMRKINHVDTRNEAYAASLLSKRTSRLEEENVIDEAAIDRYAFIRDAYLQHRRSLVYDGNPPREKLDDDEDDKPGAGSSGNDKESARPPFAEAIPAALPVASPSIATGMTQQAPAVIRVWVTQGEALH